MSDEKENTEVKKYVMVQNVMGTPGFFSIFLFLFDIVMDYQVPSAT